MPILNEITFIHSVIILISWICHEISSKIKKKKIESIFSHLLSDKIYLY